MQPTTPTPNPKSKQGKRRSTRFIDPANAQHFHLVHRSQRDPKANDPDTPQYVLLPARVRVFFVVGVGVGVGVSPMQLGGGCGWLIGVDVGWVD